MKYLYIGILFTLLTFTACDSDTTSNKATVIDGSSNTIAMARSERYLVHKGDKIEKLDENTTLKVESNLTSGESSVILLSGKARLIRAGK